MLASYITESTSLSCSVETKKWLDSTRIGKLLSILYYNYIRSVYHFNATVFSLIQFIDRFVPIFILLVYVFGGSIESLPLKILVPYQSS